MKDEIIKLRNEGLSYRKIAEKVACSFSKVQNIFDPNIKEKRRLYMRKYRNKTQNTNAELISVADSFQMPFDIISNNTKDIGEFGELVTFSRLAQLGIKVAIPFGENFPFDVIMYYNNKLYKCQIKTALLRSSKSEYNVRWNICTNRKNKACVYSKKDVDIFLLCDMNNVFIFSYDELKDRKTISLSYKISGFNKDEKCFKDYLLNKNRLDFVISNI